MKSAAARLVSYTTKFGDRSSASSSAKFSESQQKIGQAAANSANVRLTDPPPNKSGDTPPPATSLKFGARPPIPGSEEGSKIFEEVAHHLPLQTGNGQSAPPHPPISGCPSEKLTSDNLSAAASQRPLPPPEKKMSPKPSESSRNRGFEPEGSADVTPPFSESNSNQSTPAYVRYKYQLRNQMVLPLSFPLKSGGKYRCLQYCSC